MVSLRGFGLVPAAVSWQADVPSRTLVLQQAETGLSYGELFLANSIASQSKESFARIVAMRARTRTWGELMRRLQINPVPIVARAEFASGKILDAAARNRRRRGQDLHDTLPRFVGIH